MSLLKYLKVNQLSINPLLSKYVRYKTRFLFLQITAIGMPELFTFSLTSSQIFFTIFIISTIANKLISTVV